jgi:hypothetical protein
LGKAASSADQLEIRQRAERVIRAITVAAHKNEKKLAWAATGK